MERSEEDGSPAASDASERAPDAALPAPAPLEDGGGGPGSDPSDPDGAMYAAARARPHWSTKPAVKAALEELCRDLEPGEDPFFWQVAKPGPVKVSDAQEQACVVIGGADANERRGATGLESRRVYVGRGVDPRAAATVRGVEREPGGDGAVRGARHLEATLVSGRPVRAVRPAGPARSDSGEVLAGRRRRAVAVAACGVATVVLGVGFVRLFGEPRGAEERAAGSGAAAVRAGAGGRGGAAADALASSSPAPAMSVTASAGLESGSSATGGGVAEPARASSAPMTGKVAPSAARPLWGSRPRTAESVLPLLPGVAPAGPAVGEGAGPVAGEVDAAAAVASASATAVVSSPSSSPGAAAPAVRWKAPEPRSEF